jgi:hypothetical protein
MPTAEFNEQKGGEKLSMLETSHSNTPAKDYNPFFVTSRIISAFQKVNRAKGHKIPVDIQLGQATRFDIPYESFNNGNFKAVVERVGA